MTETESMVERVAKAMAKALKAQNGWSYVDDWDKDADCITIDGPVELLPVARAAIEAMREEDEITDVMLEAGRVALHAPENRHGAVLGAVFCAMLDKALEE